MPPPYTMRGILARMPVIANHLFPAWLFPVLEDELGELDDKHRQFVSVCELCAPQDIPNRPFHALLTNADLPTVCGLGLQEEQPEQEGVLARLQAASGRDRR